MKKYILPVFGMLCMSAAYGQAIVDAVRFGSTNIAGTARYRSMGGAFGALGGDPSAMNDNPAGMGIYRGTNEISFTPNLSFAHSKVNGTFDTDNKKSDCSLSNFSFVLSFKTDGEHLVNFNIGAGYNHNEGLRRKYQMILNYPTSSFGQYLSNRANNTLMVLGQYNNPEYLTSDEAWNNGSIPLSVLYAMDTYAIDAKKDADGNSLNDGVISFDEAQNLSSYQRMYVTEQNRQDAYNLNLSANWSDRLYAGLTMTIHDLNSRIDTEIDEDYKEDYMGSYTQYFNYLESKGTGFGLKAGLLYKPTDMWRIGIAAHTPIWYKMEDIYNGTMQTDADNTKPTGGDNYSFKYRYYSPWQLQLSSAWVIARRGLVGIEVDMQDFATQKFKSNDEDWDDGNGGFDALNDMFKDYNRTQLTYKVGGEYRVTDHFSLRAGFAYRTSPYKDELYDHPEMSRAWHNGYYGDDNTLLFDSSTKPNYSLLGTQQFYTAGMGWHGDWWHIDLSFMDRVMHEKIAMFPTTDAVYQVTGQGVVTMTDDSQYGAVKATHCDMISRNLVWDVTIGLKF